MRLSSILILALAVAPLADAASTNSLAQPAEGSRGMVSSAHPLATQAGIDVLERGGNAFDAAIAVAATLNVVEPQNSGIGGYGLTLIYHAESDGIRVLNSSGRIPRAVDANVFREGYPDFEANRRGAKSISTPTNLNAWWELSSAYSTLPWEAHFEAAIAAAEDGHPISASVARAIASAYDQFADAAKEIYSDAEGPLTEGELLVQKDLADTFRRIAADGPRVLYRAELAKAIHDTVQQAGGFLSLRDLRDNEAEWWEPIHMNYRGYEVYTCSPPANSFSSLLRLGMMERFDLAALGHNRAPYLHLFAEVSKRAYWHRLRYAGDPDVSPPPVESILSDAYLDEQVRTLNPDRATPFVPPGVTGVTGGHTTHFVAADGEGNIVCATQTLGSGFGSRIMVPGWGVWLNNSLYFCTFEPPGNPMDAHPSRRKLISNHPMIVMRQGRPWIAIGTPGGHTIGQTVPQMVMNMIDFGMNVQQAIVAPRISFVEPNWLEVENGISAETIAALEAMGHQVRADERIGNAHGLTIEYSAGGRPARFLGGADPRGSGQAEGI